MQDIYMSTKLIPAASIVIIRIISAAGLSQKATLSFLTQNPHVLQADMAQVAASSHVIPVSFKAIIDTAVIAIRRDYIHEGMLNAVLHAVRAIIPDELLDDLVKAGDLAI